MGVAEIQKMSPSTTPTIGLMRSQLTNRQVGIVLAWS